MLVNYGWENSGPDYKARLISPKTLRLSWSSITVRNHHSWPLSGGCTVVETGVVVQAAAALVAVRRTLDSEALNDTDDLDAVAFALHTVRSLALAYIEVQLGVH
jgi:hypothetical protein